MNLELLLPIMIGAVAVTAFARKIGWSAPLVVTAVACAVSFIPGLDVKIESHLILTLVLPPLLFSAALDVSFQDFHASLRQIRRLGIGLVVFTALLVGGVANILIGDISIAAALLLGAIIAPPDAVSATAIGKKLGLPRRVMTVLSGESLINDAAALTMYSLFLAGVTEGKSFGFNDGLILLLVNIVVGVGIGLVIAFIVQFIRVRIKDPLIETVIGLLVPFGAYILAEHLGGSGVLAVVAAGLYLGYNAPRGSYVMRLQEQPIWASLDVLLEAFVFALIGLQFSNVLDSAIQSPRGLWMSLGIAGILLVITILFRPFFVFATYYRPRLRLFTKRRQKRGRAEPELSWRDLTVISWTGMRGVVTLAAAASVAANDLVPAKDLILLTAFVVTIGTLLIQGLSLPWLIKRLKVTDPEQEERDRLAEQELITSTFSQAMERIKPQWDKVAQAVGEEKAAVMKEKIKAASMARMSAMRSESEEPNSIKLPRAEWAGIMVDMRREINKLRRQVLIEERDKGNLDEEVMRTVLLELDTEEFALDQSWQSRMRS